MPEALRSAFSDGMDALDGWRTQKPLWSSTRGKWSVATQILAIQAAAILLLMVAVGWWLVQAAAQDARNEAVDRARTTATALAESGWVPEAVQTLDPPSLLSEPLERIRRANSLSFIVVMDTCGLPWERPDTAEFGATYINELSSAQSGKTVTEDFVDGLGPSVRVIVPVYSGHRLVALVATGVLISEVERKATHDTLQFAGLAAVPLALGAAGTWGVSRRVRRQTRGMSPMDLERLASFHVAMLHSVRAGLIMVGRDQTVVLCNDEARRLLGTPYVSVGMPVDELDLDPGLKALIASGEECEGETFVAGKTALVVNQLRAMLDGEDLGTVTTLRDRTNLVRLTSEVESLRSFSDMLRSRAHEADNRLHTVVMLVEMGRYDEAIRFATESIEQSQALVDAVTGAIEDAPVAALLLGKSAQAEERGVTLRLADDLYLPTTGLAAGDVVVILGNLVDNAIDAAAEAGEPRWVHVAGKIEEADGVRTALFQVTDSGPGLREDSRVAAFQRGWTTKPVTDAEARPEGRGIGLALVSATVRRLGGTIDVQSAPSRFTVRLPLPRVEVEQ